MSEHTYIKGKCDHWHIPYREDGFTYCKRCKIFVDKIEIAFHEGWFSDWMQVNCGHCNRAIWIANLQGRKKFIKDDEKCCICGNPTNRYDCVSYGGRICEKGINYWCSNKCRNLQEKIDSKINFYWEELILGFKEQGIEFNSKIVFKLCKEIYNGTLR